MWYGVNWKFENLYIKYMEAKGSIDPIQPIFDTRVYYYERNIFNPRNQFPQISIKSRNIEQNSSAKSQPYALGCTYLAYGFLKSYSLISTIFERESKYLEASYLDTLFGS